MFRSALLIIGTIVGVALGFTPIDRAPAQNTTCSDRSASDISNACANTRFVHNGFINCVIFTDITKGCVPASGGGTVNFLRADGTFAPTGAGGSAIVGMILPWAGASVPDTYLLAYGQAISRSTYADLFSAMTAVETISCTSGNPNITVSAAVATRMPIGGAIEGSACFVTGTTVSSKSGTTLTLSNNAGATTSTAIRFIPWGNGDGSATFNVPNLVGKTMVGRNNMSGTAAATLSSTYYDVNPNALGAVGGNQFTQLTTDNFPAYTPSGSFGGSVAITDPGHTHTTNANVFTAGNMVSNSAPGGTYNITTAGTITTSTTGITASLSGTTWTGDAQGGADTPFSRVQPSVTVDYIIKALPDSAVGDSITVGVTNVAGGVNTQILYNNAGKVGEYALSTADQYNCATSGSIVQPSVVYQAETTTTYGATTTFDFCTFKNTKVTLTGDITTQTFTNIVAGKAGMITFIQDGSGNHTTVWNSALKFSGGTTPTLTTTAGAVDILTYACRSATFCGASLLMDVK